MGQKQSNFAIESAQVERERALLAVGMAQLDRGEFYDWPVIKAWMAALEHDPDATLPPVRKKS